MTSHTLQILAIVLFALALLVVGSGVLVGDWRQLRHRRTLDQRIRLRQGNGNGQLAEHEDEGLVDALAEVGERWLGTSFAKHLVADEDRVLLNQCGINNTRGQALFFVARIALALLVPLAVWMLLAGGGHKYLLIWLAVAFAFGFMAPKWWLRRRAAQRRDIAEREVPLLVDLLRLLQGVGLSVDQSLYTIENDFIGVLPLLGGEIALANRQYAAGRTREQSMARMGALYQNDDLRAIVRMLVQVDRHGGAVQEPLKQFSDRVRERRRMSMKEKIGRITVKMTGVMVLTMLPALLIITAGSGFLAVFRGLSRVSQSSMEVSAAPHASTGTSTGSARLSASSGSSAYANRGANSMPAATSQTSVDDNAAASSGPQSDGAPQPDAGSDVAAGPMDGSPGTEAAGNATAAPPIVVLTPVSLNYTVAAGASTSSALTIANVGERAMTWTITEVGQPLPKTTAMRSAPSGIAGSAAMPKQAKETKVAGRTIALTLGSNGLAKSDTHVQVSHPPSDPGSMPPLVLDDESYENAIGLGTGRGAGRIEAAAIWLNRFTLAPGSYPFTLDHIQIAWPNAMLGGASLIGRPVRLLVYGDPDGDGNPGNAILLGEATITIAATDTFENYPVNITVPGPTGDVLIGFEQTWAKGEPKLRGFPAAIDQTASQGRSWVYGGASATDVPDIHTLSANALGETIDHFGRPGNWMIRATGTTGRSGDACGNPSGVPWLSESPASGAVARGNSQTSMVTVDASHLTAGIHSAHICVSTNDPRHALLDVPVKVIVTAGTPSAANATRDRSDGTTDKRSVVSTDLHR